MKAFSFLAYFLLLLKGFSFGQETTGVIVTIKPLHSLVSGVIGNTGEATLLLDKNTSPHDFQLKPSQLRAMYKSKVIFYIDDKFETFLESVYRSLPKEIKTCSVIKKTKLKLHAQREGGAWEAHDHDHHGHDEHHEEGHHQEHHEEEKHHHEEHEHYDMHVWLDPENAKRIVQYVVEELSLTFPANKESYQANAKNYLAKINEVDQQLKQELKGMEDKTFIVFHDAYQYFEKAYKLNAVGSITLDPNESPSPKRLLEIRKKLVNAKVKCIFREPQFSDRLVNIVVEGSNAKSGTLDPLGANLKVGEGLYLQLLRDLGSSLKNGLN